MPDTMYIDVEIGGEISSKLLPDLYRILNVCFWESSDIPTSIEELRECNETNFTFSAECIDYTPLILFCKTNKLSCIVNTQSDMGWNAAVDYTFNGSEHISFEADSEGKPLHYHDRVKPLIQFLLDYAEHGITAFPLHIEDKPQFIAELAKDGLRDSKNFINLFRDKVNELFPDIPEVPLFIIKEE